MRDHRLIATLGRGGMAEVFLAARGGLPGFTKLVVIKRLRLDLTELVDGDRYRAMLLDEARLAARLRHPNIVQTFEVDEEHGVPYLAMEYLDGQPLSVVVNTLYRARAALPEAISLRVIADVLAALDYAHDLADYDGTPLGVVHRDVSPHNVFWTYDGQIKLMDFGVAKLARGRTATEIGTIKGKLTYMAPEQARGGAVDRRADVFAVGILLWELLAGRRLLRADNDAASLHRLLFEPFPRLDEVRPGVDPALAQICARALERDLERRYATAAAMRSDLEHVLGARSPRREELAAFIAPLFVDQRREVAARIREALTGGDDDVLIELPHPSPEIVSSRSRRTLPEPIRARPPTTTPPTRVGPRPRHAPWLVAFGAVLAAAIGAAVIASRPPGAPTSLASAPAVARRTPAATAPLTPAPALRLCGSNTIGAELAPALVEAFLVDHGAAAVARTAGLDPDERILSATLGGAPISIDIRARGSATAFEGLAAATCDLGMASRAIDDKEDAALAAAGFGDLRSPATEHVIALDGIAVIVHPNDPIAALDRAQLHDIFTGAITDWAQVGGAPGPITVLARDDKSGTYDTFKHLVLGKDPLVASARRFAASDALADAVASDPSAIGFIGLAYVRSAKAIAVGDPGAPPMLPTSFTVTTEGYMLARRLYWYSTPRPRTPLVAELVSFALSAKGQAVVQRAGFIDLTVGVAEAPPCDLRCPRRYAALVARAQRASLDFRFRLGSDEIDSRATRDLDRVVQFLAAHAGAHLLLLGFSDSSGGPAGNLWLSRARAQTIAGQLALRGVHAAVVEGFGTAMPVAPNATEVDRQRNRRVEVWIRGDGESPL